MIALATMGVGVVVGAVSALVGVALYQGRAVARASSTIDGRAIVAAFRRGRA